VILHETYFDSPGAGNEVTGDLEAALTRDFGLSQACLGARNIARMSE
jgi:hypothetical protein